MPHKHRLAPSSKANSNYDLPPTSLARPLPVRKPQSQSTSNRTSSHGKATSSTSNSTRVNKSHRKAKLADNDTPRAFTRLLSSYHPPPRSGLDDGQPPPSKKRKRDAATSEEPNVPPKTMDTFIKPSILPGESLSSYGARVDAALPIAGLSRGKGRGKTEELRGLQGLERRKTKAEKKLQRIQKEWREEEARRRAKRDEALEDEEMEMGSGEELGERKGKKGKRKGRNGGSDDEDPWAAIAAKRRDAKEDAKEDVGVNGGGLVGLHDVVLAPPKFVKAPVEKFKAPGKAGVVGLKRQGELSDARMKVVEGYRALMKQKLADGAG